MHRIIATALLLLSSAAFAWPQPQRPVSSIVSPTWASEASREAAGEAASVMRLLNVRAGQTVADIGAGSGYYTMRLSPVVGPRGRVIAQDIVPKYLNQLKARVRRAGLKNVRFVLGGENDPRLPVGAVDTALLIHMYHEIAQPYELLYRLRAALKPEGRIAVVDLDRTSGQHGMPRALLVCEVKAVGYDLVSITDLKPGYLAVFRKGPATNPAAVRACRE
ncbi:class I SAM-dependent methyltransferase [Sandarakinorhabdus glacialis]|nr:methyltransferase domain-containing protein [Polymorphobacter glacialis]